MSKKYSVRMRASKKGRHISGAEKIVSEQSLEDNVQQLLMRAREHSQGQAEEINIAIEQLDAAEFKQLQSLPITTINVNDYQTGRKEANYLLSNLGLESKIVDQAIDLLAAGPNPDGENMRGAVLLDIETGCRLEANKYRGVRATKMDYQAEIREELRKLLSTYNLNQTHLPEALVLATKVVNHPTVAAELCVSDDPHYQAGYIASQEFGYCRFPYLKPKSNPVGGRIFFIKPDSNQEELMNYLEEQVVVVSKLNKQVQSFSSVTEMIN